MNEINVQLVPMSAVSIDLDLNMPPAPLAPIDKNWTRPSDWTDISGPVDNSIKLLVADITYATYAFKVIVANGGTYTVDWGDGTVDTGIVSDSLAQHSYAVGTGTQCNRGYTTFVITITATDHINRFYIQPHSLSKQLQDHGYLDAEFNTPWITDISYMFASVARCRILEHCRFNSTMSDCTIATQAFASCGSLQSVDVSGLVSVTTASNMFSSCYSLRYVDISNMESVTVASQMFYNTYSLQSVDLPNPSAIVNASQMFNGCYSLHGIDISGLTLVTNSYYMFNQCYNLQRADGLHMPLSTNASNMFSNCNSLRIIDASGMASVTDASSMFSNCNDLISADITGMVAVTNASSMFANNYCLSVVIGLSTLGSAAVSTDCATMFDSDEPMHSLDISGCKVTRFSCKGSSGKLNNISSLTLNPQSTFSNASAPQIDISYCSLDNTQLDTIFTSLPTVVNKTIKILGCTGAGTCTKSIATSKGWVVT